jgi:hypothetical protein
MVTHKEIVMADNGSSGMGFMGFILGGVVVVVAILAFVVYSGKNPPSNTVAIEVPKIAVPK